MSTTNDEIEHYKRKIDKYSSDPKVGSLHCDESIMAQFLTFMFFQVLLHCLNKLTKLPIGVEHLQATGIGRIVNGKMHV